MIKIELNGKEYPLATTLRVAFMVQGQNNHKPYTEVFKELGDMGVEKQIGVIYAAFACANKQEAETVWTEAVFRDYCFDNFNIKDLMEQLSQVIAEIMGEDPQEVKRVAQPAKFADLEEPQGN